MPKEVEAKLYGVVKPTKFNLIDFKHWKFLCSQNVTDQPEQTVELCNMCPQEYGPPVVVNIVALHQFFCNIYTMSCLYVVNFNLGK